MENTVGIIIMENAIIIIISENIINTTDILQKGIEQQKSLPIEEMPPLLFVIKYSTWLRIMFLAYHKNLPRINPSDSE